MKITRVKRRTSINHRSRARLGANVKRHKGSTETQ